MEHIEEVSQSPLVGECFKWIIPTSVLNSIPEISNIPLHSPKFSFGNYTCILSLWPCFAILEKDDGVSVSIGIGPNNFETKGFLSVKLGIQRCDGEEYEKRERSKFCYLRTKANASAVRVEKCHAIRTSNCFL